MSENEQWQQKLTDVTAEMESKLAAEKRHTEHPHTWSFLEVARLQLQGLDLSSRSLLGTDIEDVSTRAYYAVSLIECLGGMQCLLKSTLNPNENIFRL